MLSRYLTIGIIFAIVTITINYILELTPVYSQSEHGLTFNVIHVFGSYGTSEGEFIGPSGVAVDSKDNIIVADQGNDRIQVFDSNGNFLFSFGSYGDSEGYLKVPHSLTVDSKGRIIVADTANNRIQVFDSNGNFLFSFGSCGTREGQFNYPHGVAVDSKDNIIVADTFNNRIQVFDSNGNFLFTFGIQGQLISPSGIAVDSKGRIIVADTENHRIQVFDSNGNLLLRFGTFGQLNRPFGVAVDSKDNILVADTVNNKIHVFNSNGKELAVVGAYGNKPLQFRDPHGIAVDSKGRIIVADTANNRLQIIAISKRLELSLYREDQSASIVNIGEEVTARVTLHDNTASKVRFTWIDPNGNIARDADNPVVNAIAEDRFAPSIEGEWTVKVSVSDDSIASSFTTAKLVVIPEFSYYLLVIFALAIVVVMVYARSNVLEKTKFKL